MIRAISGNEKMRRPMSDIVWHRHIRCIEQAKNSLSRVSPQTQMGTSYHHETGAVADEDIINKEIFIQG